MEKTEVNGCHTMRQRQNTLVQGDADLLRKKKRQKSLEIKMHISRDSIAFLILFVDLLLTSDDGNLIFYIFSKVLKPST